MFRIIPFEEIDQNKWNGTVHYSPNGNVYGYYWYLKSVIREWDAIVENDYQTVTPIFRNPLKSEDYTLLPLLGPYTINTINEPWLKKMTDLLSQHNKSLFYPLNNSITEDILCSYNYEIQNTGSLDLIDNYPALQAEYKIDIEQISQSKREKLKIGSGMKPETLVALLDNSNYQKNTLLRIIYNAMHRGLGFSSYIDNKKGEKVAASFFISSHNKVTEICSMSTSDEYRYILLDLAIRNGAEKPSSIITHDLGMIEKNMGFSETVIPHIQLKQDFFLPVKKLFNMPY